MNDLSLLNLLSRESTLQTNKKAFFLFKSKRWKLVQASVTEIQIKKKKNHPLQIKKNNFSNYYYLIYFLRFCSLFLSFNNRQTSRRQSGGGGSAVAKPKINQTKWLYFFSLQRISKYPKLSSRYL